ncbi:MAG: TlpA family protein disulfide reductase [Clostridia bacterium]|nr:TlpA family protein disulfide reductase [Clostridia bacterium]
MKKALIIIAIAVVALLLIFRPHTEKIGGGTALKEGMTAPSFTAQLSNGKTFKISENRNNVVVLNFWATWCGPCVGEMPAFEKLKNDRMSGVEIVAVNYKESKAEVDSFIKENGYTFDIAYDEKGEICDLYPTNGIPYTLIIKNGIIEKTFVGAPADAYNTYKAAIEECLK